MVVGIPGIIYPYIPNSLKGMGLVGALNPRNFRFQVGIPGYIYNINHLHHVILSYRSAFPFLSSRGVHPRGSPAMRQRPRI